MVERVQPDEAGPRGQIVGSDLLMVVHMGGGSLR